MKNLGNMMKQMQDMQARMTQAQSDIAAMQVSGVAGGGLVSVTLTGNGIVKGVKIDKSLLDPNEAEVLEDLIMAAHNDAKAKADAASAEEMKKVTGGIALPPGLKLPF